jgi:multiple sugar transport system substrate-binding protein
MATRDLEDYLRATLTRRTLLELGVTTGAGASLAAFLAACGQSAATNGGLSGSVSIWSPDTRPDAVSSEKWLDDAFHTANTGVEVKSLVVPYGDDNVKLKAGNATGLVPDIIWAYGDFLYSYGTDGLTKPVDNVVTAVGQSRFSKGALDGIHINGHYYSVPFVGFPFFIYYRKDIYAAKGLKPATTHEELLANIQACHNPPSIYGYVLTNQDIADTWNLKTAMWTHGAYFFDQSGNLALDRPETIEAWTWYKQLGKYSPPGSMAQSDLQTRQLFVDGKVAHAFTTTSMSANFKADNIGKFGGEVYPIKPGAKGASLDFYGLEIPTKAKSPQNAEAFIKFLLNKSNFQEYLARTVVGWVPMLTDMYTDAYLNNPRIAPVKEFIDIGGKAAANSVVGTGYFGPVKGSSALTASNVEKQIGDRLVVQNQSPRQVLDWAIPVIKAAL